MLVVLNLLHCAVAKFCFVLYEVIGLKRFFISLLIMVLPELLFIG